MKIEDLMKEVNRIAIEKGWYENGLPDFGRVAANIHGEVSECWEWWRNGNPPSDHIPEFSGMEEEFADIILRVLDTCQAMGLNIIGAIDAKMKYNNSRPFKHGGKKC